MRGVEGDAITTIAANRWEMAADSLAVVGQGGLMYGTKKLYRVREALIGYTGEAQEGVMFVEWYANGADLNNRPSLKGTAIVLDRSGIYRYEGNCYPIPVLDDHHAAGSGTDVALTAMRLGKSPAEAVELACELDLKTGPPVVVECLSYDGD